MSILKFDNYMSDRVLGDRLCCPNCGESYLHHVDVTVYCRSEDADKGTKVHITSEGVITVTQDMKDCPSPRRDGISIGFWCECCGPEENEGKDVVENTLSILQHKGSTYLKHK